MKHIHVAAVRAYSPRIRSHVVTVLTTLGARVEMVIDAGATDDEAVKAIRSVEADVLLIPFNAHRDRTGALVHGLRLIERVRCQVPAHASTPILCPVSTVGLAAANLLSTRVNGPLFERVLLIQEDKMSERSLPTAIKQFLFELGTITGGALSP